MMPQYTPTTCDGCGKSLLVERTLSCPKGGLVLAQHDETAKVWGSLGARSLVPSAITYEQKTNSREVQGERNRGRSVTGEWNIRRRLGHLRRSPKG